jgi:site-specific recombinase XerD
MSPFKEANELATNHVVDTPAAPTFSTSGALLPPLKTAQELLDLVSADPNLKGPDKSNARSALSALARVMQTPLDAILLDERYLLDTCYRAIRADKSIKPKRRAAIISLLNRILKRAGIIKVGSRRSGKTTLAWNTLVLSLPKKDDKTGMSTFAKYCSNTCIEPGDVRISHWIAFADETIHHSSFKKPRETVARVVRISNRMRNQAVDWPLPEFPTLLNPRQVSIPKSDLPKSFWDDIDTYVIASSTPSADIFDVMSAKQLAPDTLQRYSDEAWRTASAQVHQGRPAAEIVNLAALLDVEWLKAAMRWFHDHAGKKFLKDHLNIAATWVSFAKHYVRVPAEVIEILQKDIMGMIDKKLGPAQFSTRNIEKLDQFNNQQTVDEFLMLPYRIMDEVRSKKVITTADATQMMAAVAIEILLATMVRLKNVTKADLKKNFWPAKPVPDGTWSYKVVAKDVKNHKDLHFKFAKTTTGLIQFYLAKCRPLLLKKPTDCLFIAVNGDPKSRSTMAELVTRTVRQRCNLDVNVHLFRHIGAMLYLEQHPGNLEVVSKMLGHSTPRTTEKFYARLKATKAIELFSHAVLGGRDAMIAKLKLGKGHKK